MIRLLIILMGLLSLYPAYSDQLPLHVSGVILPDPDASYTAQQVLHLYQQNEKQQFSKPSQVRSKVNWIIAEINNSGTETEWVVNLSSSIIYYVDLYIFENGQLREHQRAGQEVKKNQTLFATHHGYIFEVNIPQQSRQYILIRTETEVYYNIGAWAQPALEFWRYSNGHTIAMVLATGMIAGLILYNLFLAMRIKDLNYLWYSFHALSYLLYFINNQSFYSSATPYLTDLLGGENLFVHSSKIHYLVSSALMLTAQFFGALFCYRFLNIAKISPLLKRLFQVYLSGVILQVLLCPVITLADYLMINISWNLVLTPLVLYSSLFALLKKVPQSGYLLMGWSIMLFNNGYSILELIGELEYSLYTAMRSTLAVALEMLIFSLALADRVRTLIDDKSAAEQASRAKSEFLAIMSHEIRTPLYGVLGTTQLLAQTKLNSQQKKYLQSIDYSGQTLLTLIDEILDYSKLEADAVTLEINDFDLRSLLYSLIALLQAQADEKGLELGCDIDERIISRLRGDSNRIRQILLNLLSNAIKFTDKGRVTLSASFIQANEQQITLKFSVIDTGIGIQKSQRENIFKHFTQADSSITRRFGGTGMGLAIAKKLVEKMNGTIDFTSDPENGSCFFFSITLAIGGISTVEDSGYTPITKQDKAVTLRCLDFLIVDDIDINRIITEDLLHFEGHRVTAAQSGEQALSLLSAQSFDIILMDIRMPNMDGIAVTQQLRERQDKTPIIGFTASVMPDEKALCLAAGMNAVLAKPLDLSDLNIILGELFDDYQIIHHIPQENEILLQHQQKLGIKKLNRLLKNYRKLSQQHLDEIESAIENNNRQILKEHAHILAGMAGSLGFHQINELACQLDKLAIHSDKSALISCLAELQKIYLVSLDTIQDKYE